MKNKWMKTIGFLFAVCFFMFVIGPKVKVFAESQSGDWGDLQWTYDGEGTLTISGEGWMPETGWNADHTEYSSVPWNSCSYYVKKIVVEDGVTNLGESVFNGCSRVETVVLGKDVKEIGSWAVGFCGNLESVTILGTIEVMSQDAFEYGPEDGITFYAKSNSVVERFAETHGHKFVSNGTAEKKILGFGQIFDTDLQWSFDSLGTLTISGTGAMPDRNWSSSSPYNTMPWDQYKGMVVRINIASGVTYIGASAFNQLKESEVIIEEGVKEIGSFAFGSKLSKLELADSIEVINRGALSYSEMETVTFPKNLKKADYAFNYEIIKNLIIPEENTNFGIDDGILYELENGSEVRLVALLWPAMQKDVLRIKEGVKSFNESFHYTDFDEVIFPSTLEKIERTAFNGATIRKYTFQKGEQELVIDGQLFYSEEKGPTEIELPGNVKTINGYTFYNCNTVKKVILNEGTEELKNQAFSDCQSLEAIYLPESIRIIDKNAFEKLDMGKLKIYAKENTFAESFAKSNGYTFVSTGVAEEKIVKSGKIDGTEAEWKLSASGILTIFGEGDAKGYLDYGIPKNDVFKMVIKGTVNSVEGNTFSGYSRLTSVVIEEGVTTLAGNAFAECYALSEVVLPTTIAKIEAGVFKRYSQYMAGANIVFYAKTDTYAEAFADAMGDGFVSTGVNVPKEVDSGAIDGTDITWTLNDWGKLVITGNGRMPDYDKWDRTLQKTIYAPWKPYIKQLTQVVISDGITYIGERSFMYGYSIVGVDIPASVKEVGAYAFWECEIRNLVLPDTIEILNYGSFSRALNRVMAIPKNCTIIDGAFTNCYNLVEYAVPEENKNFVFEEGILYEVRDGAADKVVDVPEKVFRDQETIRIREGVKAIGKGAMERYYCSKEIILPTTLEYVADSAFSSTKTDKLTFLTPVNELVFEERVFYSSPTYITELELPGNLKVVPSYTFYGDGLKKIVLNEGTEEIKYRAFYQMKLETLVIPKSVTKIDNDAFNESDLELLTLYVKYGSYAEKYAKEHKIRYVVTDQPETPVEVTTPENVVAVTEDASATITWDEVYGAEYYALYLKKTNGELTLVDNKVSGNTYSVNGLAYGTRVGFVVKAYGNGKWSGWSTTSWVTPTAPEVVPPTNLKAVAGNGTVSLTWDAVPGAQLYALFLKRTNGEVVLIDNRVATNSYNLRNLANGTTLGFIVKAYGRGKWSGWSSTVWATPSLPVVPPANVLATAGNRSVTITWDAVPGAQVYALFLKRTNGEVVLIDNRVSTTSYSINNLANGTTLGFVVKAYVAKQWSGWSSTSWATPFGE